MAKHCTNKQNKRIFCDEKSLKTTMKSKDNQYMLKSFIPAKSLSKDDINYKSNFVEFFKLSKVLYSTVSI